MLKERIMEIGRLIGPAVATQYESVARDDSMELIESANSQEKPNHKSTFWGTLRDLRTTGDVFKTAMKYTDGTKI